MTLVQMYNIEELRDEFVRRVRSNGAISKTCMLLGNMTTDTYYKCQNKVIDLPPIVQQRLKLYKVVDNKTVVGYVSLAESIDWEILFIEG